MMPRRWTHPHRRAALAAVLTASACATSALAQTTVAPITYDSDSDFSLNFRRTATDGNSQTVTGGVLRVNAVNGSTSSSVLALYDTTPGDGTATVNTFGPQTVRSDFQINGAGGSFGLFVRGSSNSQGYLGLINIDSSSTNDQFRLFDSTATNVLTVNTPIRNTTTGSSLLTQGTWYTAALTATNNASNGVDLKLEVFTQGSSTNPLYTMTATDTSTPLLSAGQIGLRMYTPSGTSNYTASDNFTVVPEPSSLGLAAGALGLLRRRRRSGQA